NYIAHVGGSSANPPLTAQFEIVSGELRPDLQIANIYTIPAYPVTGDDVIFYATIINRGTTASPAGASHQILFAVDGQEICTSTEFTGSIPTGGMTLVYGNVAAGSTNLWTTATPGQYMIDALVNFQNNILETVTTNNFKSKILTVYDQPPENIALNKIVEVSSIEGIGLEGENAVDGNYDSRWSSQFSDPQTFILDFGSVKHFDEIRIYWETAYGKSYYIQTSNDKTSWQSVIYVTDGIGGFEKHIVDETARYIKLTGITRGTVWGYSIYEFEVYNNSNISHVANDSKQPVNFDLSQNYPNPFNPTTTIKFTIPSVETGQLARQLTGGASLQHVTLKIFDVLGREVAELVNEYKNPGSYQVEFDGSNLSSGIYFYKLQAGEYSAVRKMMLIK
ncbi:MAG: discoidin domain-containing protein, partial [bacterium]